MVLAVAVVDAANAQEHADGEAVLVRGYVVDRATAQPLNGALVEFPHISRSAITNPNGRFAVLVSSRGMHQVRVRMLGYEEHEGTLRVEHDETNLTIALGPRPIILEGITVQGYRYVELLDRRRNRVGFRAQVVDRERLAMNSALNARDAVFDLARLQRAPCRAASAAGDARSAAREGVTHLCVRVRGRTLQPRVFIDETPAIGGMRDLDLYHTDDLFMIEIFSGGSHIRVYTKSWVEMEGRRGGRPMPLFGF